MLLGGSWHPASAYLATHGGSQALHPGHHRGAARAPAANAVQVSFEEPSAQLPQQPDIASLAIPGRAGIYLVPYIQSQPDLHYRVRVQNLPARADVVVTLDPGSAQERMAAVYPPTYSGDFLNVAMGDHTLEADITDGPGRVTRLGGRVIGAVKASATLNHVARGDIVAAIGDSTTEGNGGPYFPFMSNWVSALANAADWTSADGRNYPQAGAFARPEAPASFTSRLGTILEQLRGHPVLVLNDGWSGATTQSYAGISASPDLANEYAVAHPSEWIVNLGVNDPLIHATADDFNNNLHQVLNNLINRYGARNGDIHVACPIYAKDSRHDGEVTYLHSIDVTRADAGLGAAPNFFTYYRDNPSSIADEVHPNARGYNDMAVMWAQSLALGQGSRCI